MSLMLRQSSLLPSGGSFHSCSSAVVQPQRKISAHSSSVPQIYLSLPLAASSSCCRLRTSIARSLHLKY